MKKIVTVIFVFILAMLPLTINASAADTSKHIKLESNQEIIYFDDGSYAITTLIEDTNTFDISSQNTILATAQTKSGSKSTNFYNSNNELSWRVTLNGTFSYTGSSASCTASSVSHIIYNTAWKVTSATASKNGTNAIGNFTVKRYTLLIPVQTENVQIIINCSPTGVLS